MDANVHIRNFRRLDILRAKQASRMIPDKDKNADSSPQYSILPAGDTIGQHSHLIYILLVSFAVFGKAGTR